MPVQTICFTCDVEEHFHVSALEAYFTPQRRSVEPSRVVRNTQVILDIAAKHQRRGTFFILGQIAERHPQLVRDIVAAGHEAASHGYDHTRAGAQTPDEFLADITRSKAAIEQASGAPVYGYRAPSFSIGRHTPWAHAHIHQAGYVYSSSIYPGRHDLYGDPQACAQPFHPLPGKALLEVPISTLGFGRLRVPAGGGFFRLLPYTLFAALLPAEARFYCHPWEVDPQQPRPDAPLPFRAQFRHYVNLQRTAGRLDRLLRQFDSVPMAEQYGVFVK